MPRVRKYTDEDFKNAIENNLSIAGCLNQLNLRPTGGNYKTFILRANKLNISIEHFTGKAWNVGNYSKTLISNKKSLQDIFENKETMSTPNLKNRLYSEGYKTKKCEICKISKWNEKDAPLELHHIDGDRNNNSIENLQILCCNCHAQTPTHRRRNPKNYSLSKFCSECENKIYPRNQSGLCRKCYDSKHRKN